MGFDPSHQLTESDIHESNLPEQIGVKWKGLARELGFSQSIIEIIENENVLKIKECCIVILVRWMQQNGKEATVGKLKESLEKVELKNVADNLISGKQGRSCCRCNCISQRSTPLEPEESIEPQRMKRCERMIGAMSDKLRDVLKESNKRHDEMITKVSGELLDKLREEILKSNSEKTKELEQQVLQQETRIKELENELLNIRRKCDENDEQNPDRHQKTAMSADPVGQNRPRDSKKVKRNTDSGDCVEMTQDLQRPQLSAVENQTKSHV